MKMNICIYIEKGEREDQNGILHIGKTFLEPATHKDPDKCCPSSIQDVNMAPSSHCDNSR